MKAWPSWLLGSIVGAIRRTLPSTSPAPGILIRAVWPTWILPMSSTGTRPTRSYSLRAMMVNSASPLPEATAPIVAVEASISPATGACTWAMPPSGSVSRARICPAVTVSPASTRISETFSPGRSGRTMVSSRAMTMPETSTISPKHAFATVSTVTAAPLGASDSSAASAGEARVRRRRATETSQFCERSREGKEGIAVPVPVFEGY